MSVNCPLCEAVTPPVKQVQLEKYAVYECRGCGSGFIYPRPDAAELAELHSSDAYYDHPYFQERRQLTDALRTQYERRLSQLEQTVGSLKGKRMLEVGCDTGVFLEYAQKTAQLQVTGLDIFPRVVEVARKRGLDVRAHALEAAALPQASFDILCAYDLIEHVEDPQAFLQEAWRVLAPGGVLVLETPNFDGLVYRIGRWLGRLDGMRKLFAPLQKRLWPPFHVHYFSPRSLIEQMASMGFSPRLYMRELSTDELAVKPPLKWLVMAVFKLSKPLGMPSLLVMEARR